VGACEKDIFIAKGRWGGWVRRGRSYLAIRIILDTFLLDLTHEITSFFPDDFVVFLYG
jgi:hypothetical protein